MCEAPKRPVRMERGGGRGLGRGGALHAPLSPHLNSCLLRELTPKSLHLCDHESKCSILDQGEGSNRKVFGEGIFS